MQIEPQRFDPATAWDSGASAEVVVHVEQDHVLEHGIHEVEDVATGKLGGDVRVTEVEADAGMVAVQAADEGGDRARVMADVLGARIDGGEVLDCDPDPESGGAAQRQAQ